MDEPPQDKAFRALDHEKVLLIGLLLVSVFGGMTISENAQRIETALNRSANAVNEGVTRMGQALDAELKRTVRTTRNVSSSMAKAADQKITSLYGSLYSTLSGQKTYNRTGNNPAVATSPEGELEKIYRSNIDVMRSSYGKPAIRIKTNSRGLREEEFENEPPENVTRILVVGDSYVFGIGVNASDRYTDVLERRLNRENDGRYQVINAGISGAGLEDYYKFLKYRGIEYNPDIVVVGVIGNDWMSMEIQNRFSENARVYVQENYPDASDARKNELRTRRFLELQARHKDLERFSMLQNITALISRNDAKAIVYVSDFMHPNKMEKVRKYSGGENSTLVLAPREFRDDWQSKICLKYSANRVSTVDPHPSPKGHMMLADRLYLAITGKEGSILPWSYGGPLQWLDPC